MTDTLHDAPTTAPSSDAAASTQAEVSEEIAAIAREYAGSPAAAGDGETQPRLDYPPYRSSVLRHPTKDLHHADPEGIELWAPVFGHRDVDAARGRPDHPARRRADRRADGRHRPGRSTATAGRCATSWSRSGRPTRAGATSTSATSTRPPIDPNFTGVGRCLTDADGVYRFTTIKPGPYPWKNHRNAWRPAHIHFSLFGTDFTQRMITQMYFPGDPLFALDPIYQSITDPRARERLVATYDHDVTQHEWSHRLPLGHRAHRQPPHADGGRHRGGRPLMTLAPTPGQTVGPFFGYALPFDGDTELVPPGTPGAIRLHGQVLDGAGQPVPDALLELWQVDADGVVVPRSPGRCGATATRSPAGVGRPPTTTGRYTFTTVAPGAPVPGAAPFFAVTVFARGLLNRLFTRAYLPDDDAGPRRRPAARLAGPRTAARPSSPAPTSTGYVFDIRLQGAAETVFLSYPRHAD